MCVFFPLKTSSGNHASASSRFANCAWDKCGWWTCSPNLEGLRWFWPRDLLGNYNFDMENHTTWANPWGLHVCVLIYFFTRKFGILFLTINKNYTFNTVADWHFPQFFVTFVSLNLPHNPKVTNTWVNPPTNTSRSPRKDLTTNPKTV